jgi:ABC-type branched-subunit amino acid transport system substrate-binding protein
MKRFSNLSRVAVIGAASSLVLAACGGDEGGTTTPGGDEPQAASGKAVYFVDGNTADYSETFEEGTLEGVKATFPGAELGDAFQQRMLDVNPDLKDFTYGPESYDAAMLVALAAVAADSDNGEAIAQEMQATSADGTACTGFEECAKLLEDGEDINYEGVSGPIDLNSTGSPTKATIGIFQYGADNTYKPASYETGEVEDTGEVAPGQELQMPIGEGDGTLKIGTLLPQTGDLAFLGPPEFAGVDVAVKEINQAGGVLGKPVEQARADSGDGTPNIAPTSVDKLLNADADVILGAASSGVSTTVIDKITNAGVLQISPANTSTVFDTYDDKGLYFRTAPSDVLQGRVMANLVAQDGATTLGIIARQDPYGTALADNVEKFFTESGGEVVAKELYDPAAATFTAEVGALAAEDPDAIVVISFDETKKIIPAMIEEGIGPSGSS